MINDKCQMINDKGYALIAVTFIMVSFLSMAFLLFYPLVREAREDSGFYIIDRNDYRFRKALFGETVDQCGTKLAHCGGLYGDYMSPGTMGMRDYMYQTRVCARIFGTLGYPNEVQIPQEYQFNEDHFWAGYWGKRYLHIVPSDKWGYDTYYDALKHGEGYDPFIQTYAGIYLSGICGVGSWGVGYRNYAKNAVVKGEHCLMTFLAPGEVIIELNDYSDDRNSHELRLILTGSNNNRANIFFKLESGYPDIYADYRLYAFKQEFVSSFGARLAQDTGQKKLMIQVKENPNDPWITRDTGLISLSPNEKTGGRFIFRVNFYG